MALLREKLSADLGYAISSFCQPSVPQIGGYATLSLSAKPLLL